MHSDEAKIIGISEEKLQALPHRSSSDLFTDKEKAAFGWCEKVNHLEKDHTESIASLSDHYSDREIVDLTLCISLMNALNRMAIFLR